jgi:predicted CopG family antitoxin
MGKRATSKKDNKSTKSKEKKSSKGTKKVERKTMTIPKSTYGRLAKWKGGERRGISFAEAIDRLLDHAKDSGYESALASPKKRGSSK